jgi:hypothetical protein
MQATQVATAFHRPGWVYEEKVDDYRMVAYKVGGSIQLISRQGKEFTQRFPELAKAVAGLPPIPLATSSRSFKHCPRAKKMASTTSSTCIAVGRGYSIT